MVTLHQIKAVATRMAEAVEAERVILFGSHARGQARDDSDVDLMFIAPSDLPRFKRTRVLYRLLRPYPFPMDLVVYTPEEVEQGKQSPLSFVATVLREGKSLYVRGTQSRPAMGGKSCP